MSGYNGNGRDFTPETAREALRTREERWRRFPEEHMAWRNLCSKSQRKRRKSHTK